MFWKTVIILGYFVSTIIATPIGIKNMQIMNDEETEEEQKIISINQKRTEMALSTLNLPSNATSIRADITDGFSCENLSYGYYADIDNDCQVFHVCLPVVYPDGKENTFRWSFICPEETVFSQDSFTCMRSEDMSFGCEESAKYYELNRNFGVVLDSSSELNNNDMDIISNHNIMHQKSELIEDTDDDDTLKPIIKNDDQDYVPTTSTTIKPVTIKLESNKKRRKNPNRKTQQIRKITTTTTPIPLTTTTVKAIDHQELEITEKPVEKTTMKYQRFTRRPDKDNKKKIDLLNKVITTQTQKRKKPQVSLNSNTKKNDINIKKDEKPVPEKINILPTLPITTTQITIPEITIEKETFKPIIVQNVEPTNDDHLIGNNKEQEEIFQTPTTTTTTVITKLTETMLDATEKPLSEKPLSDEIIPNMPEEEQLIAENNSITQSNVPQQFINVEEVKEESMTHADDDKQKDNTENINEQKPQNNNDQQSMIINLISSLVNAENTKVSAEEKFDNIDMNVQNSPNNNNIQNNDEHLNIMSELMTTKIPDVQETVEDQNLNSEHDVVNVEEKLPIKNEDDKGTVENENDQKHQSYTYDQMTHIPVRIISSDLLPAELIAHENNADQVKEVQETVEKNDKLESLNSDDKQLVMDKLEEALLEAIKKSEVGTDLKEIQELSEGDKLKDELIVTSDQNIDKKEDIPNNQEVVENNHEVQAIEQDSEEIKPIYHRIFEEPANLLKPEVLSVLVEEQPIIHNIEEEVKISPESESETKAPELEIPILNEETKVTDIIDTTSDNKSENYVPENAKEEVRLETQPINEDVAAPSLPPVESEIPMEPLTINTNTEEQKLQLSETISSSTAEPIPDVTTLSDRTNDARSLKKKMDPRKRRFLFRSDAR